jgi:hypothetical protein
MSSSGEPTGHEAFRSAAEAELDRYRTEMLAGIADIAATRPANWHPNGFAIWVVQEVAGLGKLRLHIWPAEDRVVRPWGPRIHRHGWYLASTVLAGTYRDVLYEDADSASSAAWSPMTPYRIDIRTAGQRDIVAEDGEIFVRVGEWRSVSAPGFHHVPVGVFHETLIPDGQYAATLIIEGPPGSPRPLALEPGRFAPRRHQRVPVDPATARRLLEALAARVGSHR